MATYSKKRSKNRKRSKKAKQKGGSTLLEAELIFRLLLDNDLDDNELPPLLKTPNPFICK